MIEEIDSEKYIKHYFEKVLGELGGDPQRFLEAAVDFVRSETDFFRQAGAAEALQQRLVRAVSGGGRHVEAAAAPAAKEAPAAPAAAVQVAAAQAPAASAVTSEQQQEQPEQADEVAQTGPAAGAAAPGEQGGEQQPEEGGAEEEGSKGLKPNAGNGADMGHYSWTQTLQECAVTVAVPPGTKGRMCDVQITRSRLRVGLKGQPPVLDGELYAGVKPDDCLWNVVDGRQLEITLQKADGMQWWRCVVKGEPEIDTQAVEPESSKLADLDPEMRATVEKMMFDQRQKALGLPTSEEQRKQEVMAKFMAAHPEMDFSNAKFC